MIRAALCALLVVPCLSTGLPGQETSRPQDERLIIETDLETLRRTPEAFKSVWVRFDVQFASLGQVANPFFTRFEPSRFANFYAWSGDQPIWRREAYDDLFGMLFVSKENPIAQRIYDLQTYDRIRVTGVVQNTFQDAPWVEVMEFEKLRGKVDTATLAHLYRAERHMQARDWRKAISELSLAPSEDQPGFLRSAVHQNLGVCHLRLGEADTARSHLDQARSLARARDHQLEQLVAAAQSDPQSQLDRDVDRDQIAEADRPMWAAFENDAETPAQPGR